MHSDIFTINYEYGGDVYVSNGEDFMFLGCPCIDLSEIVEFM